MNYLGATLITPQGVSEDGLYLWRSRSFGILDNSSPSPSWAWTAMGNTITNCATDFQKFLSFSVSIFIQEKSNKPQAINRQACLVCVCITSQEYSTPLKCLIIFCVKTTKEALSLLSNSGEHMGLMSILYRKLFGADSKYCPTRFLFNQAF